MPSAPTALHNTILQGDALERLRGLPDGIVQTCVTSPPYWSLRDYGAVGQIGLEETPEVYVARLVDVFREVRRVLRDDGTCWLNIGDSYFGDSPVRTSHAQAFSKTWDKAQTRSRGGKRRSAPCLDGLKPKDLCMIPARLALALQADGWWLRADIIWAKGSCMPEPVRDRPTRSYEHLFLLAKRVKYLYDADAIREPISEASWNRAKYKPSAYAEKMPNVRGYRPANGVSMNPLGRNKRDVWRINPQPYRGAHFAVMPPALVEPCILAGSRPGDVVLDPFGGSGTVGAVAKQHGRHYLLIELNPAYIALAQERIAIAATTAATPVRRPTPIKRTRRTPAPANVTPLPTLWDVSA